MSVWYVLSARGIGVFPVALVGGGLWTRHPAAPFYTAGDVGLLGLLLYAAASCIYRSQPTQGHTY